MILTLIATPAALLTLVPFLIALLILPLHDGIARLVPVALMLEFPLPLRLPGILVSRIFPLVGR